MAATLPSVNPSPAWADPAADGPARLQWRILDTDFGGGLQFLTDWAAWRNDARRPRLLHVVAVLAQVPTADALRAAATARPELAALAAQLAAQWHGLLPGFHRLSFEGGRVLLTLCVGELQAILRAQHFEADGIRLSAASAQPDVVLKAVARFARHGTQLIAAPSAAPSPGALAQAGFQRVSSSVASAGLHAVFDPPWTVRRRAPIAPAAQPAHCAVIGAGLAGAAVAASLARRGWHVTAFDAEAPAAGASGLPVGLLAPHVSPDDALLSRLTRAGIRATWQQLEQWLVEGRDWSACGVLERRDLGLDEPADTRLPSGWSADGPNESWQAGAAQLQAAGLPPTTPALWHRRAGWVRPARLVNAWLAQPGITLRSGCRIAGLQREPSGWSLRDAQGAHIAQAERVVVAAGLDSATLVDSLPLQAVRGQVMWGHADGLPTTPVNGHGHLIANVPDDAGPLWLAGATYQRDRTDTTLNDADLQANRERLQSLHPGAAQQLAPDFTRGAVQSWAGIRCASIDRRPLVGPVNVAGSAADDTLWVCTALGSRGLSFAALCAELLAAHWHAEPLPLPSRLAQALSLTRL